MSKNESSSLFITQGITATQARRTIVTNFIAQN